jgi:hypothetical protein
MKEYSSLLPMPLQKYVMCGRLLQCRRGRHRIARPAAAQQNCPDWGNPGISVAVAVANWEYW